MMNVLTRFVRVRLDALLLACGLSTLLGLSACGGGDGAAVKAMPQAIAVTSTPTTLSLGDTLSLQAEASSGLAVRYTSLTTSVCGVSSLGVVTPLKAGTCEITLRQMGNPGFAPAPTIQLSLDILPDPHQTIVFAAAPDLSLGGSTTVQAQASSGLPVVYSSLTPTTCEVQADTGVVTNLLAGDCIVAADQAGDSHYLAATQVTQTLTVDVPSGLKVPDAPAGVTVTMADVARTVLLSAASVNSGGSPVTRYTVRSVPARVEVDVASLPASVACGGSCSGLAFTVSAHNLVGEGAASVSAQIITAYTVEQTFFEPDTQPRDSIFRGTFVFNATTGQVSGLQGALTESMTGNPASTLDDYGMTTVNLTHQLSSTRDDALGGLLVATFLLNTTNTFYNPAAGAVDFWSPQVGADNGALYYGFGTAPNPSRGGVGNAYALIFVNPEDPTATPTQAQLDKMAYADCTEGGMMGAACMTGTTVAGYGAVGSMSGYPVSQVIRKAR